MWVILSITVKLSRFEKSKYEEHWLKRQVMRQDAVASQKVGDIIQCVTILNTYILNITSVCGGNTFGLMSVMTRFARGLGKVGEEWSGQR